MSISIENFPLFEELPLIDKNFNYSQENLDFVNNFTIFDKPLENENKTGELNLIPIQEKVTIVFQENNLSQEQLLTLKKTESFDGKRTTRNEFETKEKENEIEKNISEEIIQPSHKKQKTSKTSESDQKKIDNIPQEINILTEEMLSPQKTTKTLEIFPKKKRRRVKDEDSDFDINEAENEIEKDFSIKVEKKVKRKKGRDLWSSEDDQIVLENFIKNNGKIKCNEIRHKLSVFREDCRIAERFNNHLNPALDHSYLTNEEKLLIQNLFIAIGNDYTKITKQLNENRKDGTQRSYDKVKAFCRGLQKSMR